MKQFQDAISHILNNGEERLDRTGVGTYSVFGYQMRFNLQDGFPATTTKKLAWNAVKSELLWFLEGSTDERRLCEILHGSRDPTKKTIWTANADSQGKTLGHENTELVKELGPVYGKQWRNFGGVDQIKNIIDQIKRNPDSRRLIVSAWNPVELPQMALPPCHVLFQFYVSNGKLSCQLYQRSVDTFLGLSFNIASYSLLTSMIAHVCGLEAGEFIHTSGDMHIYTNHITQAKEVLSRDPLELPKLIINPEVNDIFQFKMDDLQLIDYKSHPPIKAPMAV